MRGFNKVLSVVILLIVILTIAFVANLSRADNKENHEVGTSFSGILNLG